MRQEPISDPEGDRISALEAMDRILEKGSDPSIWLGPLDPCSTCGVVPKEIATGHFGCACDLPVGVA